MIEESLEKTHLQLQILCETQLQVQLNRMKVLLDTNIIIHREANHIIEPDIGQLFNWIDRLHYKKYIHPVTLQEIASYKNESVANAFAIKLDSYNQIKYVIPFSKTFNEVVKNYDVNQNDENDSQLLNEIYEGRIDILVTQDNKIHKKATQLGIANKVYRIQSFLEKLIQENPDLVDYEVLSVKKVEFAEVDITDSFFDTFREDYAEFDRWFRKKFDNICYVCYNEEKLTAFLYIKIETESENYSEISPLFTKKKRLKIGTLKVINNGYKIGERFLKIVFDNAILFKVDEIYVTIFDKRPEQNQLIEMLYNWGFIDYGIKRTNNGIEKVLTRPFGKSLPVNINNPKFSFPFFSRETRKFIVKIEPQYHDELFPDSLNTRTDKTRFVENEPHRNRIGKVYISHSLDRHLKSGDIIIIYRMGESKPKKYSSTVTSICIVEELNDNFKNFEEFYQSCYKRTVISKTELLEIWWNKFPKLKPFTIKLLYAHSFPTPKPTLNDLNTLGIIPDILNMPRGFIEIDNDKFSTLVKFAYKKTRK